MTAIKPNHESDDSKFSQKCGFCSVQVDDFKKFKFSPFYQKIWQILLQCTYKKRELCPRSYDPVIGLWKLLHGNCPLKFTTHPQCSLYHLHWWFKKKTEGFRWQQRQSIKYHISLLTDVTFKNWQIKTIVGEALDLFMFEPNQS